MRYLIVAGGRDFNEYHIAYRGIHDTIMEINDDVTIVSGCAKGADTIGEVYALTHDLPLIRFMADWKAHPKAAGPIRNAKMAEVGTDLLAFWDGESKGTKDMINKARNKGLNVTIIYYGVNQL